MFVVKRSQDNPILIPNQEHYWEAFATFNLCPVKYGKSIYGLYRAISAVDKMRNPNQISVIGVGKSKDGIHFTDRSKLIAPKTEWDKYGCEDPRVTYFEGNFYIFYTALSDYPFGPENIRVAVAVSKDLKEIKERHFVTSFNSKAMTLFPERIKGKIVVAFSMNTDLPPSKIVFAKMDKIEELWSPVFWEKWIQDIDKYSIDPRRNDNEHVEIGAPPLKTKYGYLLVYSHIQNYFKISPNFPRIFGIEALLLDLNDPQKIIGQTSGPILVPEESYEISGYVSNVVFPSGALIEGENLNIYYGAADTTVCIARVDLIDLIHSIHPQYKENFSFKRSFKNPIIIPISEHPWEAKATFNPAAINIKGKTYILYRALSNDNTSTIGYARVENGVDIIERLNYPIYVPREEFENKKINNANSGCEDPRLSKIGKDIYLCYTAYDGIGPPRVAISSITEKNFLAQKWEWTKPFLVTPRDIDDKDTCLIPERFPEGYFILHRVGNELCGDYLNSLNSTAAMVTKCIRIIGPRKHMWDSAKVGITAPPIKTKKGWLLLYHGVSKSHTTYRVGAVLLSLKDPAIVLARSTEPIFEPKEEYEKIGIVNNVVFPCGMVLERALVEGESDLLYIYYGGADKVVGVATMKLDVILGTLVHGMKLG